MFARLFMCLVVSFVLLACFIRFVCFLLVYLLLFALSYYFACSCFLFVSLPCLFAFFIVCFVCVVC